jgi:hypothetical protein
VVAGYDREPTFREGELAPGDTPGATDGVSGVDAGLDGASGATDGDGGADRPGATPTAEAGSDAQRPFCESSTALFCEDFDTPAILPARFDATAVSFGTLALDDVLVRSAPRSLRATISTRSSGPNQALLRVAKAAPRPTSVTRVDVKMRLDVETLGVPTTILKVQHDGRGYGVALTLAPTGLVLAAGTRSYQLPTVPIGRWFHVRLEAQLATADASVRVFFDGAQTPAVDVAGLTTALVDVTNRELNVGPYAGNASTALTVRFDDVELRFDPP